MGLSLLHAKLEVSLLQKTKASSHSCLLAWMHAGLAVPAGIWALLWQYMPHVWLVK